MYNNTIHDLKCLPYLSDIFNGTNIYLTNNKNQPIFFVVE